MSMINLVLRSLILAAAIMTIGLPPAIAHVAPAVSAAAGQALADPDETYAIDVSHHVTGHYECDRHCAIGNDAENPGDATGHDRTHCLATSGHCLSIDSRSATAEITDVVCQRDAMVIAGDLHAIGRQHPSETPPPRV